MQTKYSNILLTIIAACLVYQVIESVSLRNSKTAIPVIIKNESLPVEFYGMAEMDVNIVGIDINQRELGAQHDALPVSIDGINKMTLNSIAAPALPVKIER